MPVGRVSGPVHHVEAFGCGPLLVDVVRPVMQRVHVCGNQEGFSVVPRSAADAVASVDGWFGIGG